MAKSKVITKGYELEVHECLGCGFHTGVDATYLDQVDTATVHCPGCGEMYKVKSFDDPITLSQIFSTADKQLVGGEAPGDVLDYVEYFVRKLMESDHE